MKKALLVLLLFATTLPIAGCVIVPYPGYGYYRPHYYHRWY